MGGEERSSFRFFFVFLVCGGVVVFFFFLGGGIVFWFFFWFFFFFLGGGGLGSMKSLLRFMFLVLRTSGGCFVKFWTFFLKGLLGAFVCFMFF